MRLRLSVVLVVIAAALVAVPSALASPSGVVISQSKAPAEDRYSYQYDGLLETLDHIFVTKKLAQQVEELRYVHFDNDYYQRDELTSPTGVFDHDPPVVRIAIPKAGL